MTSLPQVAPSPASLVSNALAALPGKMLDLITSPWPKSISNQYKRGNPRRMDGGMDEKIAEMVARGQKEIARSGSNLRVGAASEGAEIKLTRAAK